MNADSQIGSAIERVAPISRQIWDAKYRLKSADGAPIDRSIEDTWRRVARAPDTERNAARPVRVRDTESAAADAIRSRGTAVSTRDLLHEVTARGVDVGGKDPLATLLARLSRSPSLFYERPYGWRLKEPRQMDEATNSPLAAGFVASAPNDAVKRGEVVDDNMNT